jgi:hypothetical protein
VPQTQPFLYTLQLFFLLSALLTNYTSNKCLVVCCINTLEHTTRGEQERTASSLRHNNVSTSNASLQAHTSTKSTSRFLSKTAAYRGTLTLNNSYWHIITRNVNRRSQNDTSPIHFCCTAPRKTLRIRTAQGRETRHPTIVVSRTPYLFSNGNNLCLCPTFSRKNTFSANPSRVWSTYAR